MHNCDWGRHELPLRHRRGCLFSHTFADIVQQTVGGSSRIGNLGRAFKSTAVWYAQSGAVSWATQDTTAVKANYGAVYEESSTKWGPILDTINGSNDIYIFIGLKNTVSLS